MDRLLIPACLALIAAGTACSIKEDRGPCPCYLQVTFTDPDAAGEAQMLGWDDDRLFRDKVRIEECRPLSRMKRWRLVEIESASAEETK